MQPPPIMEGVAPKGNMMRKILMKFDRPIPFDDEAKEFAEDGDYPQLMVLAPSDNPRPGVGLDREFVLRFEPLGPGGTWEIPIAPSDMEKAAELIFDEHLK